MDTKHFKDAVIKDEEFDVVIEPTYTEGEYLSGYAVHGESAKLLERIGMVRYISGWGYLLDDEIVKALGTKFFFEDAYKFAYPYIAANEAKKRAAQAKIDAIFAQARETGSPVVLRRYTAECNDPREECDLDNVIEYAMPDGTIKTERSHTW